MPGKEGDFARNHAQAGTSGSVALRSRARHEDFQALFHVLPTAVEIEVQGMPGIIAENECRTVGGVAQAPLDLAHDFGQGSRAKAHAVFECRILPFRSHGSVSWE